MAKVDYKALPQDVLLGRKYRVCGRCGHEMAVTTECPKRANSENKYVCCYCCLYKCKYIVETPAGKACGIKVNRKKAEKERLRKEKAEKQKKKALKQHDADADYMFFNTSLFDED